ncbi:MAG: ribosome small subunit-dependent GTPase A [Gammaproteobacteria bacterium]
MIVAAHGRRGILQTADGNRLPYLVRGRKLRVCCGDRVAYNITDSGDPALITAIEPRQNELQRLATHGVAAESVAANLSHLLVVLAPLPVPDFYLTDRYLCAARLMDARSALVWNKSDLAAGPADRLAVYEQLDYPVLAVSAATGEGVSGLRDWIGTGTAVLVGQSGVGKSSLMNALVPHVEVATAELSTSSQEGRHTTTAAVLHPLPDGGKLLDTPGVRDFVPAIPEQRMISRGFVEIDEFGRQCRFNDCSHLRETDCAVQDAVAGGDIDPGRYESYRRLMNLIRQADRGY